MSYLTSFKPKFTAGHQRYFVSNSTKIISDYLLCNGNIISQNTYPELYSVVGLIPDGISFPTLRTSSLSGTLLVLGYGNGIFLVANNGTGLATSTDTITWTTRVNVANVTINAFTYGNGVYVYAGANGAIATSTNAITWTARTSGTTRALFSLTYGAGVFVYAGANGAIATSTDAITWTARTSGTTSTIYALTYGNNSFIYAGANGALATSTDAITWTARFSRATYSIYTLAYGNGVYVYGGAGSVLGVSSNSIDWTRIVSATSNTYSLTYDGSVFILVGVRYVATSLDGINWRAKTSDPDLTFNSLAFGNETYIYCSSGNRIWTGPKYTYNSSIEFVLPSTNSIFAPSSLVSNTQTYIKIK
jgi:hypothetical protein